MFQRHTVFVQCPEVLPARAPVDARVVEVKELVAAEASCFVDVGIEVAPC